MLPSLFLVAATLHYLFLVVDVLSFLFLVSAMLPSPIPCYFFVGLNIQPMIYLSNEQRKYRFNGTNETSHHFHAILQALAAFLK